MTKITFENLPSTNTPLSAENMNLLQTNVENAISAVENEIPTIDNSVSTSSTNGVENQAITNYVNGLNTYSTTEQVVGTWINGKPLYRKVMYISSLPNNTTTLYDIFSAQELTTIDICFIDDSGSYMIQNDEIDTMNWIYSTTGFIMTCIKNKRIRIKTTDDKTGASAYVSINYTKTTD